MSKSDLEQQFLAIWRNVGRLNNCELVDPVQEYKFHQTRQWRFDFAWPRLKVAVEIEGGVWNGGRHTTGKGVMADCDKYNAAAADGWRVLRFTDRHLRDNPHGVWDMILATMDAWKKEA